MKQEEKPLPKIAASYLRLLQAKHNEEMADAVVEAAECVELDLTEGWKLRRNATAFFRDVPEPEKPDATD